MGNVQGKLTFRVHNGATQFSKDEGVTWTNVGVGGDATLYTVPSDVQDYDITSLNGDVDGDYLLSGYIIMPNSVAPTITLRPNQLTTNQTNMTAAAANASSWVFASLSGLYINSLTTAASGTPYCRFKIMLTTQTGRVRMFMLDGVDFSGTAMRATISRGTWTDTATNITSLRIHSDVAASIKQDSFFVLQKLGVFS